jgi:dipeptidase E
VRKLMLISNATRDGLGYLEHAQDDLQAFLPEEVEELLFVPYAVITKSYETYVEDLAPVFRDCLGRKVVGVHTAADPAAAARTAQAIVVGGGNTWMLHRLMREHGLIEAIRQRALAGVPYIGWSAGTTLACPTIKTSNDMLVTDPHGLAGLGLVPFQINPHFMLGNPPGFHGETRETRIREFVEVNRDVYVAGLREGMTLRVEGDSIALVGIDDTLRVFHHGEAEQELAKGEDVAFLLDPAQRVAA